jgi:hypothetical protein
LNANIERHHSSYRVLFPEQHVVLEFEHLRNGREALNAEVRVGTNLPGFGPILIGPKGMNILSERTQAQWASTLGKRCDVITEWDSILNEACTLVLTAFRQGEPSVALGDIPKPDAGTWLIPGLVLQRMPVILFGDGSAGKSLIALAIGESIQRGDRAFLGLMPTRQTNVMILDWEYDGWEHAIRAHAITGGSSQIRYRRMFGPLADQVESIEKEIDQHNIGLLITDSAAYACGGKPEDSEQTNRFFDALRLLNCGSLIIAHETKGAGILGNHDKPFGSVYWHNGARATWFVQKQQDEQDLEGKTVIHIGLFNKKTNQGRLMRPLGWQVQVRSNDAGEMLDCAFAKVDVRDIEGLRETTSLRQQIQRVTETGRWTKKQIWEELNTLDHPIKEESVNRAVIRMERAKQLVVVDSVGGTNIYAAVNQHVDLDDYPE